MHRQLRPPPAEHTPVTGLAPEFDPTWCMKVVPVYVALGAGGALLLAVALTKDDFSHSAFLSIALLFWWCVVAGLGAVGGIFVGMLSCSAARSAGAVVYQTLAGYPDMLRRSVTLAVQISMLSVVGLLGFIWVAFSDSALTGYRGT